MNRQGRHEWQYAGETFSTSPEGEIERAVSWHNGAPTWKRVLRAQPVSIVTAAVDACAAEIIRLSLRVDELEEAAEGRR